MEIYRISSSGSGWPNIQPFFTIQSRPKMLTATDMEMKQQQKTGEEWRKILQGKCHKPTT